MYRHLFSFTLPVELCSGRPNCGATQSFGEKLCLRRDSFGWPDAVVQLLFWLQVLSRSFVVVGEF